MSNAMRNAEGTDVNTPSILGPYASPARGLHLLCEDDASYARAVMLETTARFEALFESNGAAHYFARGDGRLLDANDAFLSLVGYSREEMKISALNVFSLVAPEMRAEEVEAFRTAERYDRTPPREVLLCDRNGKRTPVLMSVATMPHSVDEFLGVALDITEQKRVEEQLLRTQRLEAVGSLADGIAHDFNNLLSAIMGNTDLLRVRHPASPDIDVFAATIGRLVRQAGMLTSKFMAFSHKQATQITTIDLNQVVAELCKVLPTFLKEDIELTVFAHCPDAFTNADHMLVEQAIFNLAMNSREAMPNGGQLTISTINVELSEGSPLQLPTGQYVRLTLKDSGCGIAPELRPKIFDPFFSTKDTNAGLGLSTVYNVAKQSGGAVEVESMQGQGTSVHLYFPLVEKRADGPERSHRDDWSGQPATILFVEDQPSIRDVVSEYLRLLGYSVHTAADGFEALSMLDGLSAQAGTSFDLIIADVVMPRMSGVQMLEEARKRAGKPVRSILISGHARDELTRRGMEASTSVLRKPFGLSALSEKIEEVLKVG